MRNIFLFIRRYITFIAFMALQFFALWMFFRYNKTHHAVFMGVANEVTGRVNTQVDKLDDYFHQGEENKRVHRMNDSLLNLLRTNFNTPDTTQRSVTDSMRVTDSTKEVRRYLFRDAKVVYNSVSEENNYLQLNRGSNQGIRDNMAVINSNGAVVGLVVNTSPTFSQVMSLLHTRSRVPSVLKKGGTSGTISWDKKDYRFLNLEGISRDVEVKKGDTVLTSPYSYNYPPSFMVGTIQSIAVDKNSGFYLLKVRAAANFNSLQQVFVVENLQLDEQVQLLKDTEKKVEQDQRQ